MGYHVTGGDERLAPTFHFNHSGASSWGGKPILAMTGDEVFAMMRLCVLFGRQTGWNDATSGHGDVDKSNCFHPKFAEGVPYNAWRTSYLDGAAAARAAGVAGKSTLISDEALREEWLNAGGAVHGPNIETVTMPESAYFQFRRSISGVAPAGSGDPHIHL